MCLEIEPLPMVRQNLAGGKNASQGPSDNLNPTLPGTSDYILVCEKFAWPRFPFAVLTFQNKKGLEERRSQVEISAGWIIHPVLARSLSLPGPVVNSCNRINISWILRYRGSSNQFCETTFSAAPIGLFLPRAASSISLRKCKKSVFFYLESTVSDNCSAFMSLANQF